MRRCAPPENGAPRLEQDVRGKASGAFLSRSGFTLMEMCIVLLLMAVLLGATMPAIDSAYKERALRNDSGELESMVRMAMLRGEEQHRAYVIEITPSSLSLHPADPAASAGNDATDGNASASDDDSDNSAAPEDVVVNQAVDSANKLSLPDPDKPGGLIPVTAETPVSWTFQPGELCPAPRVHWTRGEAWLETSFNALTGDVENETYNFP